MICSVNSMITRGPPAGLVSFFSLLVLGLGAHIVSVYRADFAGLGIAVSLLTLLSLIPMYVAWCSHELETEIDCKYRLILSFMDKVLWVNMVVVEVGWLGLCFLIQ